MESLSSPRDHVLPRFETTRRELTTRREAEDFWGTLRCLKCVVVKQRLWYCGCIFLYLIILKHRRCCYILCLNLWIICVWVLELIWIQSSLYNRYLKIMVIYFARLLLLIWTGKVCKYGVNLLLFHITLLWNLLCLYPWPELSQLQCSVIIFFSFSYSFFTRLTSILDLFLEGVGRYFVSLRSEQSSRREIRFLPCQWKAVPVPSKPVYHTSSRLRKILSPRQARQTRMDLLSLNIK